MPGMMGYGQVDPTLLQMMQLQQMRGMGPMGGGMELGGIMATPQPMLAQMQMSVPALPPLSDGGGGGAPTPMVAPSGSGDPMMGILGSAGTGAAIGTKVGGPVGGLIGGLGGGLLGFLRGL